MGERINPACSFNRLSFGVLLIGCVFSFIAPIQAQPADDASIATEREDVEGAQNVGQGHGTQGAVLDDGATSVVSRLKLGRADATQEVDGHSDARRRGRGVYGIGEGELVLNSQGHGAYRADLSVVNSRWDWSYVEGAFAVGVSGQSVWTVCTSESSEPCQSAHKTAANAHCGLVSVEHALSTQLWR